MKLARLLAEETRKQLITARGVAVKAEKAVQDDFFGSAEKARAEAMRNEFLFRRAEEQRDLAAKQQFLAARR